MKRRFTAKETNEGSLAIRDMSEKAQEVYYGTGGEVGLFKYVDDDATYEREQEAFEKDIDFMPGSLDVVRYAVSYFGDLTEDLTFEEAEALLEGYYVDEEEDDE